MLYPRRPDASVMTWRIVLDIKGFPPDDSREVDEDLVDDVSLRVLCFEISLILFDVVYGYY